MEGEGVVCGSLMEWPNLKLKFNTRKRHTRLIVSIYKKKKMTVEISKLTSHRLILPPSDSYAFQREAEIH